MFHRLWEKHSYGRRISIFLPSDLPTDERNILTTLAILYTVLICLDLRGYTVTFTSALFHILL